MLGKVRIAGLSFNSVVNGEGIRDVVFLQGCNHGCAGCQNPHTHSLDGGFDIGVEELIEVIEKTSIDKKITISGGEPFLQPNELLMLLYALKKKGYNIWVYTGYKIEELMSKRVYEYCLKYVDVLVDGKYDKTKPSDIKYIGSTNQRIIEVDKWRKNL